MEEVRFEFAGRKRQAALVSRRKRGNAEKETGQLSADLIDRTRERASRPDYVIDLMSTCECGPSPEPSNIYGCAVAHTLLHRNRRHYFGGSTSFREYRGRNWIWNVYRVR